MVGEHQKLTTKKMLFSQKAIHLAEIVQVQQLSSVASTNGPEHQFSVRHEASTEDQTACRAGLPFVKASGRNHKNKQSITGKLLPCTVSFSLSLMTSFSLFSFFFFFLNSCPLWKVFQRNSLKD